MFVQERVRRQESLRKLLKGKQFKAWTLRLVELQEHSLWNKKIDGLKKRLEDLRRTWQELTEKPVNRILVTGILLSSDVMSQVWPFDYQREKKSCPLTEE